MQGQFAHTILQVVPALDAGGVERTTLEMAEAISEGGGSALVASAGGRLESELRRVGGQLLRLPLNTKNPVTLVQNAYGLIQLARSRGVQLIHARSRAPAWSALWAARALKLPYVTTYHGIYNGKAPWKRLYNSVMARGDLVIANSNFTRAHVMEQHRLDSERIVAIPRGVDLERFSRENVSPERIAAVRANWGVAPDEKRLVALVPARLTRWKGQLLLIQAAAMVSSWRPNGILYILAGDPQGRKNFVAEIDGQIVGHGMDGEIRRVGHIEDMPAAFGAADFAIFPPTGLEAFGRGAAEAQAMGIPTIVADAGGLPETLLPGESGLMFRSGEAYALAAALERMLEFTPEIRRAMGECAVARARERFSKAALQNATLDVYRRLLER